MNPIRQLLRQVRSRMVGERALRWSLNGAALAALGALVSEIVFRRWPLDPQGPVLAFWVLAGAVFALVGWRRAWPSWVQVARLADARLGGRDRLVTALEFAAEGGWLYQRQRQDAAAFAGSARLSDLGPLEWPWRTLAVALAAGLAATVLALLPNPALQQLKQHQAAVAAQNRAGDQVGVIARQAAGQTRPGEDPQKRQALTQDLQKAADAVRKAPDPQSALASLSQAQDQLRELQDPALGAKQDAAAAAGRALTGNPQAAKAGSALAGQDMKSATKELNNLAGALPTMNEQQKQQLADSLARASASAGADPKLQQSLENASDSLKKGDVQAAQQALQAAAQEAQSVGASEDFQGDVNQAINGLQQAKGPLAQQASGQQPAAGQGQDQSQAQGAAGQGQGAAGQGQGAASQGQGAAGQGAAGQGQGAAGQGQGAAGQGQGAAGQGASGGSGSGANGSGGGNGSAGSKPGAGSEKVYVPGQAQGTSGNGTPDGSGQGVQNGLVPYDQVLGQYQSAALSQVDRADIPEQERQLVQQYFNNLSK
jgi:hypothetical protein